MALVTGTAAGGVQLVSGNPTGVSVNRQPILLTMPSAFTLARRIRAPSLVSVRSCGSDAQWQNLHAA